MGILDSVRGLFQKRSISEYVALANIFGVGREPYFMDSQVQLVGDNNVIGLTDNVLSSEYIYNMVVKDTYYGGMFEQLIDTIFENDFYFVQKKNDRGTKKGNKRALQSYKTILEDNEYKKKIEKIIYGLRGDGGGNVLLFTTKKGFKVDLKIENFLADGKYRVRVYGDDKNRIIKKYEVIDQLQDVVYSLDVNNNYVSHVRYKEGGHYAFSTNPAKRAVYWYVLKNRIAGATLSGHKNGFQEPYILTTDYTQVKAILEAMNTSQISASSAKSYLKDPLEFIAKQAEITDAILASHVGDTRKSGQVIRLPLPSKIDKIGRNSTDMSSKEWLEICDEQIGYALRTSKGILNTKDSKYSNAETERDNWSSFVVDSLKTQLESVTTKVILPIIIPEFNRDNYEFKLGRDPNEEDIKLFETNTARNTSIAMIISQLNNVGGYAYDLENNKIIQVEKEDKHEEKSDKEKELKNNEKEDIDEEIEDKKKEVDERALKKKDILDSKIVKDHVEFLDKAINKQIRNKIDEFKKYKEDIKINDINNDVLSINNFGVNVNVYKNKLLKAVLGLTDDFMRDLLFKDRVNDLMDARAELMIKGWDYLKEAQQKLIINNYGGSISGYSGFDAQTSNEISTIVKNAYNEGRGINGAVNDLVSKVDDMSYGRAMIIAHTDIAQSVEASRFLANKERGMDEKSWNSMRDGNVRPLHLETDLNAEWVGIDEDFSTGLNRPSYEILCRCYLMFRRNANNLLNKSKYYTYDNKGEVVKKFDLLKNEKDLLNENGVKIELLKDKIGDVQGVYNSNSKTISVQDGATQQTVIHEVGHAIDDILKETSGEKDFSVLIFNNGKILTDEGYEIIDRFMSEFQLDRDSLQKYLLGDVVKNKVGDVIVTHPDVVSYYTDTHEIFAEGYSLFRLDKNFGQYAPNLNLYYEDIQKHINDLLL